MKWARRFYEAPDFDHDERDYKFEAVAPLAKAREELATRLKRGSSPFIGPCP